jgi:hypothetical protein
MNRLGECLQKPNNVDPSDKQQLQRSALNLAHAIRKSMGPAFHLKATVLRAR